MRLIWIALVLLSATLSGCIEDPAPGPDTATSGASYGTMLPQDDPHAAYTWNGTNLIYDVLEPTTPRAGTTWTYAASGAWALSTELSIVAAQDDTGALVFGAPAADQLINSAVWGQYWYGPMGDDLNQKEIKTKLLDWPLFDGKTFPLDDLVMFVVADLVETPLGTLAGYRIEGADNETAVSYTFVPEIGYLTSYSYGSADGTEVWESLELRSVTTSDTAVWHETGDRFSIATGDAGVGPSATVDAYDVAEGFDEIIFVGLGTTGARAAAQASDPVAGGSWGFEDAEGYWDWKVGRVSATSGPWILSAASTNEGWASFEGVLVRWVVLQA